MSVAQDLFGSGKDVQKSRSDVTTTIPDYLKPRFDEAFKQYGAAQSKFPSIGDIPDAMPLLNIPGLTPEQQALIQQIMATGSQSPYLTSANQQIQQLTSGPIGSSPATQQAMEAYQKYAVPELLQQQSLAGRGSSGAAFEALAEGSQHALSPLLQQEISNREASIGQYGALQSLTMQGLAQSLEAAGLPREVALQQAAALYDKQQKGMDLMQMTQTLPLGVIPQLLGKHSEGTITSEHINSLGQNIGAGLSIIG